VDHDRAETTGAGNAGIHLAHWTFYMLIAAGLIWVPAALLGGSGPLLAGLVVSSVVVCELMISVHDTIHRPGTHRLIEGRAWFRFLDEHHYIHHVDTEANVNFLLPLSDWLFGTLRVALTEAELARHGTWRDAKERLVGAGEPAHQAVLAAGLTAGPPTTPAAARA
jgi:sterol desaturase/sphingolipid hydroxylase (fatty acid hydroxylase superfamily)